MDLPIVWHTDGSHEGNFKETGFSCAYFQRVGERFVDRGFKSSFNRRWCDLCKERCECFVVIDSKAFQFIEGRGPRRNENLLSEHISPHGIYGLSSPKESEIGTILETCNCI